MTTIGSPEGQTVKQTDRYRPGNYLDPDRNWGSKTRGTGDGKGGNSREQLPLALGQLWGL